MIKNKSLIFLILIMTFQLTFNYERAIAEEYICSISWQGEVQTTTFLRDDGHFKRTHRGKKVGDLHIIKETRDNLFLYSSSYDSLYINIINKLEKTYSSNLLMLGLDENEGQEGTCIIR